MGVGGNCGKIVICVFVSVLTEPVQILDWIRNYCVRVDYIAVRVDCIGIRCYGYCSGLWVVGGKCRKLGEDIVCRRYI